MDSGRGAGAAACLILALAALYLLFFFAIGDVGLLGPDEPRYASIGREMARSGDWITPRLWGEVWMEKPPLLYWLCAASFRLGLPADVAPRAGVAVMSVLFLALYLVELRRALGRRAAWVATVVLATSAGWAAFSQVGVTDLPMSASYGAGMLLAYRWLREGGPWLRWAGVCFGLAVLGKGLVPLVLAAPLLLFAWRRWREFIAPVLAGLAVAGPWYGAMFLLHGNAFWNEFFLKHHFGRFASTALQHEQPWWFYVPVLLAGFYPWFPLLAALRRDHWMGRATHFFAVWFAFGFLFFSLSANKLPGYILPLFPALAALVGSALDRAKAPRQLAVCVLLLAAVPLISGVLPEALLFGLSGARVGNIAWGFVPLAAPAAALVWWLDRAGRREAAITAAGLAVTVSLVYLKLSVYPVLDRMVSARHLAREVQRAGQPACVGAVQRSWVYGLNYYTGTPLPECETEPRVLRVTQEGEAPPRLESAPEER